MSGRIKILQIVGVMNYGGIETLVMNLYRNIDREKFEFCFVSHGKGTYDEEIKELGGELRYITPKRENPHRNLMEMIQLFRSQPYGTLAHFHISTSRDYLDIKLAQLSGIKTRIAHAHSSGGMSLRLNLLYKNMLGKSATDYIACSEEAAAWLFPSEIILKERYKIFNNAIDSEAFQFNASLREKVRKELGINKEIAAVHIGSFYYVKNHIFLVALMRYLVSTGVDIRLFLIGNGKDKEVIQQQVEQEGLENHIIFLGQRNDVNRILQAMDVFIMPSLFEGLPMASLEAQASGLPCIFSTGVPKIAEVTENCHFIDLNASKELWKEEILSACRKVRKDTTLAMTRSGFDIKEQTRVLETIYRGEEKKCRSY